MKYGERYRAVHLVLTGDDDGIEESLVGGRVQSVGQGDGRTELLDLHDNPQLTYMCGH